MYIKKKNQKQKYKLNSLILPTTTNTPTTPTTTNTSITPTTSTTPNITNTTIS
jgi:hypothetical protein